MVYRDLGFTRLGVLLLCGPICLAGQMEGSRCIP